MKDTNATKNERILNEVRRLKMESYKKRFEPKIEVYRERVIVELPLRNFEIVLNGESICTIQFIEIQKKLDQIYSDFRTLQIEGCGFVFEDGKCNFIVNTTSKLLNYSGVKKLINVINGLQLYMNTHSLSIDIEVKILYGCSGLNNYVAQKGSNMRNFYTSKVQSVFKNLINDNKSRFHKEKRLALASILAAFLGESIGSYYEFQNYPEPSDNLIYKQETPSFGTLPGQLTDDGELALAEAFAILDSNANINFNKLAFHNGIWVISRPFDCGTTTKNSLSGIKDMSIYEKVNKEFYQWAHTGSIVIDNAMYFPKIFAETILKKAFELNYDSLSNGFLMKKSSISILSMRLVKDDKVDLNQDHIKDMSSFETLHKFDTSLTHSNPLTHNVSILYSLLYTRLIYLKIHYDNLTHKEIIVNVLSYMRGYVEGLVKTELNFFFDQYKEGKMTPESVAFKNFKLKYDYLNDLIYQINEGKSNLISFSMINNEVQGYFAISIFLIFHYLHKLKDQDLKSVSMYEIIKEIITFGGDTDTNGAICSAILGILFDPLDLVQRELLDILLNCNVLESKKQRPVIYSPGFSLFFIYFYYKMRERDYERKRDFLLNYGPQPISAAIFSLILTVGNLDDINFDI